MKKLIEKVREWYRIKQLLRGKHRMNLGTSEPPWPGYVTSGLGVPGPEYCHDASLPFPGPFIGHFDFIWSERMLEHVSCDVMDKVLTHVRALLQPGGRIRFCLPICFYGSQKINMLRPGNAPNCDAVGHVTWFTLDGYGPVTPDLFGSPDPHPGFRTWESLKDSHKLQFEAIRHYDKAHQLYVNEAKWIEGEKPRCPDYPEIVVNRRDSIVFDLVRID